MSTALSELFTSELIVTAVKTTIPWGSLSLIPALAVAAFDAVQALELVVR